MIEISLPSEFEPDGSVDNHKPRMYKKKAFRFRRKAHTPTSIGATGFEPAPSCSQSRRSAKLSYAPRSGDCRLPVAESQGCDGVEAEFSSRESRQIAGGA
jgi:hypothetical protein